ncbi:ComEC/Rec2 family competence protein [Glaciihabitans sp. UYNi722]|uniref:ComEC/Rec2 family competence protein n=1 Tax=Glaciihabitans sp. UYNi722 TaxID=3156344 RepID=UPI0033995F02
MNVDLRLALPVGVAWATVAVVLGFPQAQFGVAIAAWALAIAASCAAFLTVLGRRRGIILGLALCLAASALLVTVAAVRAPQRQPELLVEAASAGRHATVSAMTTETVHPNGRQFAVRLGTVSIGDRTMSTDIPVTVFGASTEREIGIGTTMRLGGTLAVTDPDDDVGFLFFSSGAMTRTADPPWYLNWANSLRAGFRDAASALPGDGGRLLPGLAIGDTSAVDAQLDAAMKATSLSHLTAVSGANCAVVIALIMVAGGALGLPRGLRIGASVTVLLGFVVLVTPEPSVLRAAVMATLVLAATASGRPVRGVPILALAVIVLLTIDPWLARSYGFVLSVLATAGLLVLAGPLATVLSRWLPPALSALLAIPIAAQIACQPVLILLNPTIPTYGVFANVLAEPAAPVATVLGLVACILVPVAPPVGQLIAQVAWLPSSWIAAVAGFFAGLQGSNIPWPGGLLGMLLVVAVSALALVVAFRRNRSRMIATALLAVMVVGYLGIAGGEKLRGQLSRPANWQIAACDIGQGDAVLVKSLGKVALVDTGPDPALLTECLDTLGIDRIDLLILSHYDLDHVGGTAAVFGRVDHAMIGPPSDTGDERLSKRLTDSGATVEQVSKGLTGQLGELRWEVLWPRAKLGSVEPGNDASVTVRFSGIGACASGCLSAIFLGDLGDQPQALMMAANRIGHVDVVKVAHHGSADQNDRLYAKLTGSVGLISVGIDNTYGHPTDKLLGILAGVGTRTARTDLQGLLLVSPRPDGQIGLWSERAVSPDGGSE